MFAMTRRSALIGGLGLGAAAMGLSGCTKEEAIGEAGTSPLTIGLTYIPNVQFSPFYVALEQGLFTKAGLDVKLRHHGQQEELFGAVLKGTEDIVFASADEVVVAASKGQKLQAFATAYQTYPIEVMGLEPLVDLASLRGRSLGVPGHYGSNYYAALAALHQAGLTDKDVTITDIGYTQVQALTTGKIDYIMGFRNNELVQLESQGKKVHTLPVSEPDKPTLVGPSLVAKTGMDTKTLKAVADVMKKAEEAIIADPKVALDATAKQVPALSDAKQRESAEAVLKATSELWKKDGAVSVAIDEEAFARMSEFMLTAKIIEKAPEKAHVIV